MCDNIKIVIGSWGSYNECNERALGSKWLDLSDYSDWGEIVEELKKEGFELDGIDEELFIQDVEGIEDRSVNWDYVNPETLFNTLKESGVLDNDYKYKVFCAFLEVRCYDDFEEKVNSHGDRCPIYLALYFSHIASIFFNARNQNALNVAIVNDYIFHSLVFGVKNDFSVPAIQPF